MQRGPAVALSSLKISVSIYGLPSIQGLRISFHRAAIIWRPGFLLDSGDLCTSYCLRKTGWQALGNPLEIWKNSQVSNLCCPFFTPNPISHLPALLLQLSPRARPPRATQWDSGGQGKTWGLESHRRQRAWTVARWRLLGVPDLCAVRDHVTSANWLHQVQRMFTFSLPPMLGIFISAGQAPSEATSEYSQHFRICGFWRNYTPSLLSTTNHIRIIAFINTGQEAEIELLGWYKTNPRKTLSNPKSGKSCQYRTEYTTVDQLLLKHFRYNLFFRKKQNEIIIGVYFALEVYMSSHASHYMPRESTPAAHWYFILRLLEN